MNDKKGKQEESHCALSELDQIDVVNLVNEADHMDGPTVHCFLRAI